MPRQVWLLGLVSLLMDISSEMIHGLLPVFLVGVLGAGTSLVGLIEGAGEATASITMLLSGWLSDRLRRRKPLAVAGYGLAAFSKPLFALAPAASWVLAARFTDRIGKGLRDAPRDALLGDLVGVEQRGAAFGLRQSLDTVGAFAGRLIAIALMVGTGGNFRLVFWVAVVPALAAVALLAGAVREPRRSLPAATEPGRLRWRDVAGLDRPYWMIVGSSVFLTLGQFSAAFLVLRARERGLPAGLAPAILVIMNLVYAGSAYPSGVLADRIGRARMIAPGFGALILADLALALAPGLGGTLLGVAAWGLQLGLSEGVFRALVADTAAPELRGTAYGLFDLARGLALLAANLMAGLIWERLGPAATFLAGAGIVALGSAMFAGIRRRQNG